MIDQELVAAARAAFAPDFASARAAFAQAAAQVDSYPSPARGPDGAALATDTSWIGDREARRVVVLISGIHGAEGYAGSAIQIDLLRNRDAIALPDGVALLLIHAANPHGFAWDRRVTEEGCDLNRNFVDFAAPLPDNPGYDLLADHLVPSSLDAQTIAQAEAAIEAFRRDHGELAFQVARKSGQHRHPAGMFFGGTAPTAARRTLEMIMTSEGLAERDFVTVVDVHTGLGPYGYGEAQSEHASRSRSHAIVQQMFGAAVTSVDGGTSFSVPVRGSVQIAWQRLRGDGRHAYLCLEYGTYDQEASRLAYRQDHWLHAQPAGDVDAGERARIRDQMRRFFNPPDPIWQEMVLARGRQILRQAIVGTAAL